MTTVIQPPWILTHHALQRMEAMGLDRLTVIDIIEDPDLDTVHYNGKRNAVKNGLIVSYNPDDRVVITVAWRREETYRRAAPQKKRPRRRPNPEGR